MSRPTFSWRPAPGAGLSGKPAVTQTKFGDGYEVRVPVGINTTPRKWSLKFPHPSALPALAFLEARAGSESFAWTDPLGQTGVYVCREWKAANINGDVYDVTADFEQVFEY